MEKKKNEATQEKMGVKPTGKKGAKDPEEEDDPIYASLKERMAAGGISQVVKGASHKGGIVSLPTPST